MKKNSHKDNPMVSVLICTYNRADVLRHCLDSLVRQAASEEQFEVIVVDNNSTDDTAALVQEYTGQYAHFHYILETDQGLSYARNRAYRAAHAPWLLYLDDDARAEADLVSAALELTRDYPYDIYGGVVLPWYLHARPKWFRDHYAEKDWSGLRKVTPQSQPGAYAKGCLMMIRKEWLDRYGDFSVDLGMTGNTVAYGEETELQQRLRAHGARLAFAPQMVIHHLVAPYKMQLDWFFRSAFALGRDNVTAKQIPSSLFQIVLISLTAAAMLIVHLLIFTPRLLSSDYYFENWAIDVFRKVTKRIGTVYTLILRRSSQADEQSDLSSGWYTFI